jgi:phospholipase A1
VNILHIQFQADAVVRLLGLMLFPTLVMAQTSECFNELIPIKRLDCYDRVHRSKNLLEQPEKDKEKSDAPPIPALQRIQKQWNIGVGYQDPLFVPHPYKPTYILGASYTNHINSAPYTSSIGHRAINVPELRSLEAEFQLSFKSRLWRRDSEGSVNLWAAYTQSSRWQVYTSELSRPFRETNYEPELILQFHTPLDFLAPTGWHGGISSIAFNHQSNGRELPLSRSWNRIIGEVSFHRNNWDLSLRPWWRIKENPSDDDNPDIENYMGRGEILLTWNNGTYKGLDKHVVTMQLRHSLKTGRDSHGSIQLNWAFPLCTKHLGLHGYLRMFNGYGDSLIDYNFRQTKIGLGVSLEQ